MTMNALSDLRQRPDLEQRLSDLESKVEDLEEVLMATLPLPQRGFFSWLRGLFQARRNGPGSTIRPR
jgi:hypothetical protein